MMITRSEILTEMYRLCFDQQLDPKGWRTNENGKHYHIDSNGRIDAGFGGKFNGLKPSEIGKVKEPESRSLSGMALPNQTPEVLDKRKLGSLLKKIKGFSSDEEEQKFIEKTRAELWDYVEEYIDSGSPLSKKNVVNDALDEIRKNITNNPVIANALLKCFGENDLPTKYAMLGNLRYGDFDNFIQDTDGFNKIIKENANPEAKSLFEKAKRYLVFEESDRTKGGADFTRGEGISINIDLDSQGKYTRFEAPYQVVMHESGHNIDYMLGNAYEYFSESYNNGALERAAREDVERHLHSFHRSLNNAWRKIRNGVQKSMTDEWGNTVNTPQFTQKLNEYREFLMDKYKVTKDDVRRIINGINDSDEGTIQHKSINGLFGLRIAKIEPKIISAYSDILHGVSYDKSLDSSSIWAGYGHTQKPFGKSYWSQIGSVPRETFANLFAVYTTNKDAYKYTKKRMKKACEVFEEIMRVADEQFKNRRM